MKLTFKIDKLDYSGTNKSVRVVHYTITGTNEDGSSASLQYRIGFPYRDGSVGVFTPYEELSEALVIQWVKDRLNLTGNYDEVMEGVKMDIQNIINEEAKPDTPWA